MDGAFIAYHNTRKIYGYEYVKLKEMALRIFGNEYNLDASFVVISKMQTIVLDEIRSQLAEFRGHELKVGFYADYPTKRLMVTAEVMSEVKQYEVGEEKFNDIFEYY